MSQLEQLELRTSKGGFNVAERNKSAVPVDIFIIQPTKSAGDGFGAPLAIPMHNVGIVEQYTGQTMRAYSLAIASSGRLEEHTEAYDSLVIALTDSIITEGGPGDKSEEWKMKTGILMDSSGNNTFHSEYGILSCGFFRIRVQLTERDI